MFNTFLLGEVPSKKNRWARSATGQVYIPGSVRKELDDLLIQLKSARKGKKTIDGPVIVNIDFMGPKVLKKDVDNMATTILDLLQQSEVIENDRNVVSLTCIKVEAKEAKTGIRIHRAPWL